MARDDRLFVRATSYNKTPAHAALGDLKRDLVSLTFDAQPGGTNGAATGGAVSALTS